MVGPLDKTPRITLAPMRVPKASDVLAEDIKERILSGGLSEGDVLPPERELVSQTRLSRATVREALRVLEVQGLLQIKTGRSGGAFVRRPGHDAVTNSIELVIRGQQTRLSTLHEAREAIEPDCAALAAVRRTDDDLRELEESNQDVAEAGDDLIAFRTANIRWHTAVAEAGRNELLLGFMRAISKGIYRATEIEQFTDEAIRATTFQAHARVNAAIRDRDPEAARRRMTRHVHGFADAVLAVDPREQIPLGEDPT